MYVEEGDEVVIGVELLSPDDLPNVGFELDFPLFDVSRLFELEKGLLWQSWEVREVELKGPLEVVELAESLSHLPFVAREVD